MQKRSIFILYLRRFNAVATISSFLHFSVTERLRLKNILIRSIAFLKDFGEQRQYSLPPEFSLKINICNISKKILLMGHSNVTPAHYREKVYELLTFLDKGGKGGF